MAKKAARGGGRKKTAARRTAAGGRARAGAARRVSAGKGGAAARKGPKRVKAGAAKKTGRKSARPASRADSSAATRSAGAAKKRAATKRVVARKAPALDRARRIVRDEDIVPTPPSSLNLDRSASAVRTGRHEMSERVRKHTETSPALTGGDVDADWESAYSVGDEAPGGDNPTPDQDIVDDIGRAVGVEYADNEELKGEKKISDRDRKRWELDPASSEDYEDR